MSIAASITTLCLLFGAGTPPGNSATGREEEAALSSRPGSPIRSFYLREISGKHPTVAFCLVCRYGNRPVAMICTRTNTPEVENLIVAVDRVVAERRGTGLRGFSMFFSQEPKVLQPALVAMTKKNNLVMPLTLPLENARGPGVLALPEEGEVFVILYKNRTVVSCMEFNDEDLTGGKIREVVAAVKKLHEEK